jgi:hypothetical protein
MKTDLQQYNIDRKASYSIAHCRPFKLKCSVFDVAGMEYLIEVEFREILDDVFEGKAIDNLPLNADHIFHDVNNYFSEFIRNSRAELVKVYDNFNNEIR